MKLTSTRMIAIAGAVILIPVDAVARWLLSPLFLDKTVEEEFPFAFTASVPADITMGDVENVMSKMDAPATANSPDAMARGCVDQVRGFQGRRPLS